MTKSSVVFKLISSDSNSSEVVSPTFSSLDGGVATMHLEELPVGTYTLFVQVKWAQDYAQSMVVKTYAAESVVISHSNGSESANVRLSDWIGDSTENSISGGVGDSTDEWSGLSDEDAFEKIKTVMDTYEYFEREDTTTHMSTVGYHSESGMLFVSFTNMAKCKTSTLKTYVTVTLPSDVTPVGDSGCAI